MPRPNKNLVPKPFPKCGLYTGLQEAYDMKAKPQTIGQIVAPTHPNTTHHLPTAQIYPTHAHIYAHTDSKMLTHLFYSHRNILTLKQTLNQIHKI